MKEERITKKYRGKMTNHNQMDRPNLKIGGKYKKTGNGRIETAGDFSVIVNPYF